MPRTRVPLGSLAPDAAQFNAFGPFQTLTNLAVREPGMVEPLPGRLELADSIPSFGRRIWGLKTLERSEAAIGVDAATGDYYFRAFNGVTTYTPSFGSNAAADLIAEPCGLYEARDRAFYAGPNGVVVFDSAFASGRMLGMMQPTLLDVQSTTTVDAAAISPTSAVAYRATAHRRDADGYEMASPPTYARILDNIGGSAIDANMRIGWPTTGTGAAARFVAGDVIKLWRTREVATATSPNDTFHLVAELTLTATDITNRYVQYRDRTPPTAIGEELYTNPGMQGALEANTSNLGPSTDAAFFNEHAFYAMRSAPAFIELRINGTFGSLGTAAQRASGIGRRGMVGGITITSTTVTGLSAAELVGLAVGQYISESLGGIPAGTRIQSINSGAGTLVMTAAATATNAAASLVTKDVLVIDGTVLDFGDMDAFLTALWTADVAIIPSLSVPVASNLFGTTTDNVVIRFDAVAPEASLGGITATNFSNYSPAGTYPTELAAENDERLNRILWSKLNQPDHVPASHELTVGAGEIVRLHATQDRLFVFCTDGLYAISGAEGRWSVDRVDRDFIIPSQAAVDEMGGDVYAYAKDRGLMRIGSNGSISDLSEGALQTMVFDPAIAAVADSDNGFEAVVACDDLHDEVGVFFLEPIAEDETNAAAAYVLNMKTLVWRKQTPGVVSADDSTISAWAYSPKRRSLVWFQQEGNEGAETTVLYMDQPNVADPLPGAELTTFPYVPDNDPIALKMFHEISFSISSIDTHVPQTQYYTASVGASRAGETTAQATSLPGNTTIPPGTPAFFQLRHMVTRQAAINGHVVINFAPYSGNTRWRLHAIDVVWQPESSGAYNR